jgi:hypothetical protein
MQLEDTKEVKEVPNIRGMTLILIPTTPDGGTILTLSGATMIKPNTLNKGMEDVHKASFRSLRFLKTFLLLLTLILVPIMIKCLKH